MKYKLIREHKIQVLYQKHKEFVQWLNMGKSPKEAAVLIGYSRSGAQDMADLYMRHVEADL